MLDTLIISALNLSNPVILLAIFSGSIIGFIFGAMPGLGSIQALALVLPFTFGWDPVVAMFFYAGIMGATSEGGSVAAILLNTPGTPINAATALDGYPMARRGEAGRALGLAAGSSVFGAFMGLFVLVLLIPFVEPIVLAFGPPEIFWLVLFGLVTISFASRASMLKGLAAGGLGILLSMIGYSDVFGVTRWAGGSQYLWDGLELVAFFVGIFAISEVIEFTSRGGRIAGKGAERIELREFRQVYQGVKEVFQYPITFVRSSLIGTFIGIIPGIGGTVANFIAYTTTLQVSRNRNKLGTGHPEGIVASEASNDAKDGGAIFPTLAFGIPGSAEMAILLGAMILLGLNPGPMILQEHPNVIWALVLGLVVANLLASIYIFFSANSLTQLTFLPVYFLGPIVVILAVVGSYALRGNLWDVGLTLVAGFFGFCCKRFGYPIISLAIGFVLGSVAENAFHHSLMIAYGQFSIFFSRPISLGLMSLTILIVLVSIWTSFRTKSSDNKPLQAKNGASLAFITILTLFVVILMSGLSQYNTDVRLLALVVGLPTLALMLVQFSLETWAHLKRRFGDALQGIVNVHEISVSVDTQPGWVAVYRTLIWLVGFFIIFLLIGFLAATPLFLFMYFCFHGRSTWMNSAVVTAGVWLICFGVFHLLFQLRLWPGLITEIIPGYIGGGIVPAI